jgi:hypothetical protein
VAEAIATNKPDAVFIDAGRGEGVIDRLRQLGYDIVEVNFGGKPMDSHYVNKRAEMWDSIRHWLDQGGQVPDDTDLHQDLCTPLYSYANAANKFALESKDQIRNRGLRSPDIGDAVALTFAYPVQPRLAVSETGALIEGYVSARRKNRDYDPLAR